MLLGRPGGAGKYETINDASGFITNAWRSIKLQPAATASFAEDPPSELCLKARSVALAKIAPELPEALASDPEWCDPKLAGWWVWCQSVSVAPDSSLAKPLSAINKGIRHGVSAVSGIPVKDWFYLLARRLRTVSIACGDWSRVVTPSALGFSNTGTTPCAVFADPPYLDETLDYGSVAGVAQKVAAWCAENGHDKRLRIVLAGHVGDYDLPGWTVVNWGGSRGYGREKRGDNECLWLSPHCLPLEQQRGLFDLQDREKLYPGDQPPVMKGLP
jgi:hypothetical protein